MPRDIWRVPYILNAWSSENELVLGQLAVPGKSNEITAMPQLADILELKGCIVTAICILDIEQCAILNAHGK